VKLMALDPAQLVLSPELSRSGSAKQFEERLRASIEEIGLAEPLKVAELPDGKFLVVDGTMRLHAINAIRESVPEVFPTVPVYVVDYAQRFELRYQSDVYQDLLPSQLAALVEHLHKTEHVRKVDIARYIGVSAPTLRNYTGLWRLMERRGLFARIVDLMDVEVIPSSNPYAWLRLNHLGVRSAIEGHFSEGVCAEDWIEDTVQDVRRGTSIRFPIKFVEAVTSSLEPECYREEQEIRTAKRDLGLRRGGNRKKRPAADTTEALQNLRRVHRSTKDPVLRSAAKSLQGYLR